VVAEAVTKRLDDEVRQLEQVIAELRDLGVDTTASEKELDNLCQRSKSVQMESDIKLSELLTAVEHLTECQNERSAIIKWIKEAENQLKAIDCNDTLSCEEKLRRQEVSFLPIML